MISPSVTDVFIVTHQRECISLYIETELDSLTLEAKTLYTAPTDHQHLIQKCQNGRDELENLHDVPMAPSVYNAWMSTKHTNTNHVLRKDLGLDQD